MLEIMTALMDFIRNIDMLIYVYHDGRLSIDFENQLPTILLCCPAFWALLELIDQEEQRDAFIFFSRKFIFVQERM